MQAGLKRDLLMVQAQAQRLGASRGLETTWADVGQLWARAIADNRPSEDTVSGLLVNANAMAFDVDYLDAEHYGITNQHALVYKGERFEVVGSSTLGADDTLRIFTQSLGPTTQEDTHAVGVGLSAEAEIETPE